MCRVWDIARGKCERVMEGHTGRLNSVRLGPNNTALTASDDYTARVWDLSTGTCQHVLKGALLAALTETEDKHPSLAPGSIPKAAALQCV